MRYYAGGGTGGGFKLAKLPGGLRLVLALYLVVTCLGFWLASLKYVFRGLLGPTGVERYYLGAEELGAEEIDPLLELAGPKDWSFLVDTTHPHLFTVPLVFLVLCHLVQLCERTQRFKNALYFAAFGGAALSFGLPWLLRFAPWLSIGVGLGGLLVLGSGTLCCVLPLVELWRRPERARRIG